MKHRWIRIVGAIVLVGTPFPTIFIAQTAQTAQAAVNAQALNSVQSTSGVNLDEEAASLLQWQQAYQAAAQALSIGNSLFTTLIDSVNGTFT